MSLFFADRPEYFNFIHALECENNEYRNLHQRYAKVAQKAEEDYKNAQIHITTSINSNPRTKKPVRTAHRHSSYKNETLNLKKSKKRSTESFAPKTVSTPISNQFDHRSNSTVYTAMPARTNGAQRILNPSRLRRYKEDRRDPAILVGIKLETGYQNKVGKRRGKPKYTPSLKSDTDF